LECDHLEQQCFFKKLKHQLAAILTKHALHPSILTAFWLGLLAIRNDIPYPNVYNDLPPEISTTVCRQAQLGWDQLYYGCLTNNWAKAIDTLHPELALSGQQVMTQLIQMVWHYILATWTMRNQHFHQDAGQLSIPDYQQAVEALYEHGAQLPPEAQEALFQKPLNQMLEQPPTVLQTWFEQGDCYMNQQLKAVKICA